MEGEKSERVGYKRATLERHLFLFLVVFSRIDTEIRPLTRIWLMVIGPGQAEVTEQRDLQMEHE